jgi:hypothetical protein
MPFVKDPEEILDYGMDWSEWLEEDAIQVSRWGPPTPITTPPLVVESTKRDPDSTVVKLSGGKIGMLYQIENTVETAQGRTAQESIFVRIQDK